MNDNSEEPQAATEDAALKGSTLPILRMSTYLNDQQLRDRLTTQWEFLMLTSAFITAVSVTFLVVEEPESNTDHDLWAAFLTINCTAFLLLLLSVVFLLCFLTTLMVAPKGGTKNVLVKLVYVEPVPSIALFCAIILMVAAVPVYMKATLGPGSYHTAIVGALAGLIVFVGLSFFFWNSIRVQKVLLDEYENRKSEYE